MTDKLDKLPDVVWIAKAHLWDQPSAHRQIPMIPLSALEAYVASVYNCYDVADDALDDMLDHFKQAAGQEESNE